MRALGRHILAEFFHCDVDRLSDPVTIQNIMMDAANACGATIVQAVFHSYNPQGVSGVVVIAESHLAIHTWPEYGHAAVDVFTCGDSVDPWVAFEALKVGLRAREVSSNEVPRIILPLHPSKGNGLGGKKMAPNSKSTLEELQTSPPD